jgi:hypothetical protein
MGVYGSVEKVTVAYGSGTFFSESPPAKNSVVKRAWPRAIFGWVTDREIFPGVHK